MDKYQPYSDYKYTGALGLESIPLDWDIHRIKFIFNIGRGRVISEQELEDDGKYPVYSSQTKNDGCLGYINSYDFDCEQITWTTDGANAGTVFLRIGKHNCTNVCGTLQPKTETVIMNYTLYCLEYVTQFHKRPDTNGAKIMNNEMAEISIAQPEFHEQQKIANFLDYETAKIDTLIAKQQQLIKLLKEKRQAVISRAVTKGLNPDAPMRDSGVEWLGEVPEHWIVSALKYHVDTVNGFGFSSSDVCEEGVPFIRAGNIKKKSITPTDLYLPQKIVDRYKRVILSEGDIVISMVGSDPRILESAVGQVGVVTESMSGAVPNQNIVILREKLDSVLKRFLFYTLCSEPYRNHLNVFSHKLANQSIISSSLIVNAKFTLPNTYEQKKIIEFLDQRLAKFDEIIARCYNSLELLKERRTALISAAVTGKIDVRNWVESKSLNNNKEVVA